MFSGDCHGSFVQAWSSILDQLLPRWKAGPEIAKDQKRTGSNHQEETTGVRDLPWRLAYGVGYIKSSASNASYSKALKSGIEAFLSSRGGHLSVTI